MRLRDLHEELSSINIELDPGEHVDDETISALGQLVTDVGTLVDQAKAEYAKEKISEEHKSLSEQIAEFDRKHPRVREFLSQMTDVLAMIGI